MSGSLTVYGGPELNNLSVARLPAFEVARACIIYYFEIYNTYMTSESTVCF